MKQKSLLAVLFLIAIGLGLLSLKDVVLERWYLHRLTSADIDGRRNAAKSLARIQSRSAVPYLLELLNDFGHDAPGLVGNNLNYAGRALRQIREPAIPELVKALKGERGEGIRREGESLSLSDYRLYASQEIAQRGAGAARAVPALLRMLESPVWSERHIAAITLAHLSDWAEHRGEEDFQYSLDVALPSLIGLLTDTRTEVRTGASYCLSRYRERAEPAVDALVAALGDQDEQVRRNAVEALGHVSSRSTQTIPFITALLDDESEVVRSASASALFSLRKGTSASVGGAR